MNRFVFASVYKFLLLFLSGSSALAQIAAKDASFSSGTGFSNTVYTVARQADGKYVVGGAFTTYNGQSHVRIVRLNSDGSVDPSFNSGTGFNSTVYSILVQEDAKLVVMGGFTDYNATAATRIIRLNTDGSVDPTFVTGSGFNNDVYASHLQSDGSIVAVGAFSTYGGTSRSRIARVLPTGAVDNTFQPGSGFNGNVFCIAQQPDGKFVVGGQFTSFTSFATVRVARLNTDGSFDSSFLASTGANSNVNAVAIQNDGKIILGGSFTTYEGQTQTRIARLMPTGAIDGSFSSGNGFNNTVDEILIDQDNNIVVMGTFTTYNTVDSRPRIARLLSTGAIDMSFNVGTGLNAGAESALLEPDGRILTWGSFTSYNAQSAVRIIRLLDHAILSTSLLPFGPYCAGQTATVAFAADGMFNPGNVFIAQLSDQIGNFSNAIDIGTLTGTTSGSVPFVIPSNTISGSAYRIRVVSTDPPAIGTDLGGTSSISITAIPSPSVSVVASPGSTVCAGAEVLFTATPFAGGSNPIYQWYVGADVVPGENDVIFSTNSLANGDQVKVSMLSNATCMDGETVSSVPIAINIVATTVATVSISSNVGTDICFGQSVSFMANALNAGGAPAYQWKRNGSNVGLGGNTYTTTSLSDGDVITCVVFSNATCPDQVSVVSNALTMTVNPNVIPTIAISVDPANDICSGTVATFNAVLGNEGGSPFLVWQRNGLAVGGSASSYTDNIFADGDEVVCVLTSSAPCASPAQVTSNPISMTVTQSSSLNLAVTATPSGPICEGDEVVFMANTDEDDDLNYQWTVNGLSVGDDSESFASSALQHNDVVQCTVSSSEQCVIPSVETSGPIVMQVASSEPVSLTIGSDIGLEICAGQTATFEANVTGAVSSPLFQWTVNGAVVGGNSPIFSTDALMDGALVSCTLSAIDPCSGSALQASHEVTVSVGSAPVLNGNISGATIACAGEVITYDAPNAVAADGYLWTLPLGWTGTSATSTIITTAAAVGGTISVAAFNSCGSSAAITVDVSSFPDHATISGVATLNGAPVFNGWVFAYKEVLDGLGYVKADSTVILGGNYSFDELPIYGVPFILKAVATVSAADHAVLPGTIPTFFARNMGNGQDTVYHQWDRPDFDCSITAECGAQFVKNFKILSSGTLDGDCSLNGSVNWFCPPPCKMASDIPIPGVDVVVEKVPPGNAFTWGETGADGRFRFEGVPVDDTYRVYVAIPGIPMADTYSVIVTPSDTAITQLDFVVDTVANLIYIVEPNGIAHSLPALEELVVLPNPMHQHATVMLPSQFGRAVFYRITGIDGRVMIQLAANDMHTMTIQRGDLPAGLYFLEVTNGEGRRAGARMVVQ